MKLVENKLSFSLFSNEGTAQPKNKTAQKIFIASYCVSVDVQYMTLNQISARNLSMTIVVDGAAIFLPILLQKYNVGISIKFNAYT